MAKRKKRREIRYIVTLDPFDKVLLWIVPIICSILLVADAVRGL